MASRELIDSRPALKGWGPVAGSVLGTADRQNLGRGPLWMFEIAAEKEVWNRDSGSWRLGGTIWSADRWGGSLWREWPTVLRCGRWDPHRTFGNTRRVVRTVWTHYRRVWSTCNIRWCSRAGQRESSDRGRSRSKHQSEIKMWQWDALITKYIDCRISDTLISDIKF